MRVATSRDNVVISVRAEPGEDLVAVLYAAVREADIDSAALISAAGSLAQLSYGVVSVGHDGVPRYTEVSNAEGAIEITGLHGHVGLNADRSPTCHLHGNFTLFDGSVVAGHVYAARVLVTIEMTLLGSQQTNWIRAHGNSGGEHVMPVLLPSAQ